MSTTQYEMNLFEVMDALNLPRLEVRLLFIRGVISARIVRGAWYADREAVEEYAQQLGVTR